MSFPAYEEYKDSGVEWLGKVPEHWIVSRVSYLFRAGKGKHGQKLTQEFLADNSGDYPVYSGQTQDDGLMGTWNEFEFDFPGDGVLFSTTVGAKAMHLKHLSGKFSLSQNCLILWPTDARCNVRFFSYHLQPLFADERGKIPEHMQASFRIEDLYSYPICLLPLPEQTAIASFLDTETSKIDSLVDQQRRLIELLKEKRQAVISHAVTKGLDPSVPMKDSGIEWLGEVPEGWEVIRLKMLIEPGTSISYGIVQPGDPLEEGVPFVQTTNMTTGNFSLDLLQRTTSEIAEQYPRSTLAGGEVLLGIRASIGAAHVVPDWLAGANLSRGVARIAPNENIRSRFLVSFLRSDVTFRYWGLSQQGSTFNEVSIATVRELSVAVPPPTEQDEISEFVAIKSERFGSLVAQAERAIELLQERRTALISAAVTGKIDVREFVCEEVA